MDEITPTQNQPENTNTAPVVPDGLTSSPTVQPETRDFNPSAVSETAPVASASTPVAEAVSEPALTPFPEAVETAAPIATDVQKKKSALPLVMIIVLLVVVGLAAAAYFAFVKKDTALAPSTNTPVAQSVTKDPATVSTSIENSMKQIDDEKDYSSTDLNDTTLGL